MQEINIFKCTNNIDAELKDNMQHDPKELYNQFHSLTNQILLEP